MYVCLFGLCNNCTSFIYVCVYIFKFGTNLYMYICIFMYLYTQKRRARAQTSIDDRSLK